MQMTIYYTDSDQYLIDKIDEKAYRDRKSRSAVILTVLEQFFEGNKRLGEILCDMGKIEMTDLENALESQKKHGNSQRLGELLIESGKVNEKDVQRALAVQNAG